MTDKAGEIVALLTPTITSMGLELLGIEYVSAAGGALLRLYIDVPPEQAAERSVGIDECEAVSREVSAQLDVADPISANYTLEVSSPGVDRPLFGAAQFARFVGETAKVTLKLPQDGRRRFQALIRQVDGTQIVFELDGAVFTVDAENVDKAKLVPDWVALGLAPAQDASGRDARPGKQKKATGSKPVASKNPTNKTATMTSPDAE